MRRHVQVALAILVAVLCLVTLGGTRHQTEARTQAKQTYARPTLLIHGYHAGVHTFGNYIMNDEVTRTAHLALRAVVSPRHIRYFGDWDPSDKHPLIQVVFKKNRAPWNRNAVWLNKVLRHLRKTYNVHTFNAVAHSRGCLDLLVAYAHAQPLRLKRAVLIGGAYDGALWRDDHLGANRLRHNGEPLIKHPEYHELMNNAPFFPRGTHVLSIMGDIGNGSDGVVTNVSTQSLGFAMGNRFASYRTVKMTGPFANHHALPRTNTHVWAVTNRFLWRKHAD